MGNKQPSTATRSPDSKTEVVQQKKNTQKNKCNETKDQDIQGGNKKLTELKLQLLEEQKISEELQKIREGHVAALQVETAAVAQDSFKYNLCLAGVVLEAVAVAGLAVYLGLRWRSSGASPTAAMDTANQANPSTEQMLLVTGEEFVNACVSLTGSGMESISTLLNNLAAVGKFDYRSGMILLLQTFDPHLTFGLMLAALGLMFAVVSSGFAFTWILGQKLTMSGIMAVFGFYTVSFYFFGTYLWRTGDSNMMITGGWFFFWGLLYAELTLFAFVDSPVIADAGRRLMSNVRNSVPHASDVSDSLAQLVLISIFPSVIGIPTLIFFPFGPPVLIMAAGQLGLLAIVYCHPQLGFINKIPCGIYLCIFGVAYIVTAAKLDLADSVVFGASVPEIFSIPFCLYAVGALSAGIGLLVTLLNKPEHWTSIERPACYLVLNVSALYLASQFHRIALALVAILGIAAYSASLFFFDKEDSFLHCISNFGLLLFSSFLHRDLFVTMNIFGAFSSFFLGPAGIFFFICKNALNPKLSVSVNVLLLIYALVFQHQTAFVTAILDFLILFFINFWKAPGLMLCLAVVLVLVGLVMW